MTERKVKMRGNRSDKQDKDEERRPGDWKMCLSTSSLQVTVFSVIMEGGEGGDK